MPDTETLVGATMWVAMRDLEHLSEETAVRWDDEMVALGCWGKVEFQWNYSDLPATMTRIVYKYVGDEPLTEEHQAKINDFIAKTNAEIQTLIANQQKES